MFPSVNDEGFSGKAEKRQECVASNNACSLLMTGTAGEAQTVRCLYQLCELPQHVTNAASGSNFVTLHDNYSFTVTVNRDFHGQLLSRVIKKLF